MKNDQRLHRDDLQRRHPRPLQPRTSLFADSSTYPSHVENEVGERSDPWSTDYSFAQPELASTMPLEPSMFIGCSWEPSIFALPANGQMLPPDRTLYPEPNEYYSTSHIRTPYDLHSSPIIHTQSRQSIVSPLSLGHPPETKNYTRFSPKASHASSRSQNRALKDACTEQVVNDSKPYAYLLYEALRSAKDHRLSLQEIYRWFENNTNKANDPNSKGWQSSIRHNLSMNEAFVLHNESSVRGKSKSNYWALTEEALQNGVQSTTRYRSSGSKRPLIAPQQSEPVKKGGNISKFASRSWHISHYSGFEPSEQPHSSQGLGAQQSEVVVQTSYYPGPSMLFPMSAPNTIVPSSFPSES